MKNGSCNSLCHFPLLLLPAAETLKFPQMHWKAAIQESRSNYQVGGCPTTITFKMTTEKNYQLYRY